MYIRECYNLEHTKIYELNKYCDCKTCKSRTSTRNAVKRLCIFTNDKNKIDEIKEYAKNWECDKDYKIMIKYKEV
jgi:hypothetical protein